ncbi:MAG: hypothetical protein QOI59_240, partial [Gammaproteobacteria bacterium]|nr:hypothetical protein [Gammaproteobacteria bacterium]
LSITVSAVNTVYGGPASALTYSAGGLIDGDTAATTLTGALTRITGGLSGSGHEGAGTYAISQGSVAASLGYQLTFTGANYTISPRPLALTAAAQSKVYDGTTAASATLSDDHISGDLLTTSFANAAFLDPNAGKGKTVNVTGIVLHGADAANYALQLPPVATTADITPATLTYVANPVHSFQYAPLPQLTGTVTGFAAGESLTSATTGTLVFSTGISNSNVAGIFASEGSGLAANFGNYVFTQAAGNTSALVIRPSQELRAPDAPSDAYPSALISVTQMEGPCARYSQGGGNSSHCETSFQRVDGLEQLPVALADAGLRLPAGVPLTFSY